MTRRPTFEDDLDALLQSGPTEAPAPLLNGIVRTVPALGQRRGRRLLAWSGASILNIAKAAAGVAVVIVVGAVVVSLSTRPSGPGTRPAPAGSAGSSVSSAAPTMSPALDATASPMGSAQASVASASAAATASPNATASLSGPVACGPGAVHAQIAVWEGAMGQRIATVELTNTSATSCTILARSRPQLVDGHGEVLIDSVAAAPSATLTLKPGGRLQTLVEDGNYCGATPTGPVSLAFVLGTGDRIIASPVTPTDMTLPPCNGSAVPATIQMQPWAP